MTFNNYISLRKIFLVFLRIGAFTFGGGYAMLPLLEREVVYNQKWISPEEFLNILGIAQAAPGAVAINSGIFLGFKIARFPGAIVATLGLVLPAFLVILIIASFFTQFRQNLLVQQFFRGVGPAVAALIFLAVFRIGQTLKKDYKDFLFLVILLLLYFLWKPNPVVVIISGGFLGLIVFRK